MSQYVSIRYGNTISYLIPYYNIPCNILHYTSNTHIPSNSILRYDYSACMQVSYKYMHTCWLKQASYIVKLYLFAKHIPLLPVEHDVVEMSISVMQRKLSKWYIRKINYHETTPFRLQCVKIIDSSSPSMLTKRKCLSRNRANYSQSETQEIDAYLAILW